jgi:TolB-like protein
VPPRLRDPKVRPVDPLSAVAVLPFASAVEDSALTRFGRDLVVTLSEQLDGIGQLHVINPSAALSHAGAASTRVAPDRDVAAVRALGASGLLGGTLTRNGGRVLAVVTLRSADDDSPIARAAAVVTTTDVAASADSLRTELLHELWRAHGWVPNAAAVTTHDVAALRAYVAGERAVLANRMPAAALQFERAIEADSNFWYGYWRLAWAREFMGRVADSTVSVAYQARRGELPEHDRLLIEARQIASLPERIERMAELARQMPGYWPALLDHADLVIHRGPYAGVPLADAREPLDRAVLLEPALAPAWDARMIVALSDVDTTASAKALASLEHLGYDSASLAIGGFEMLAYYRYLDHLARNGGVAAGRETERIAQLLAGEARPEEGRFQGGMSRYGFHRARIEIGRYVLAMPGARKDHLAFEWGEMATTWASRGAWDSAMVAADRATGLIPTPERTLFAYRLAAMGVALGELAPAAISARREVASAGLAALPPARRIELAWVNGVAAAAAHDRAALLRARGALAAYRSPLAGVADSSLLARELDLEGHRREATTLLRALLEQRYGPAIGALPYLGGMDRLLLSRWLGEAGGQQEATRLLRWHEALVRDVQTSHANALLAGYAYLERAKLEEATGQREASVADYHQFLRRYDLPSAVRRPVVEKARAVVARHGGP